MGVFFLRAKISGPSDHSIKDGATVSNPRKSYLRPRGAVLGILLAGARAWLLLPSPVDPAPYQPEPGAELTGPLAPNSLLTQAEKLAQGQVHGPEDIAVDSQGRIYGGTEDGKIVRLGPTGDLEIFATTGGRPLGLHFDTAERLVVADAVKGLLRIDPNGQVEVLSRDADNLPFAFTDDLDIASDGRIYFSDASSKYGHETYLYDLLEARPHGRLLRWDPSTGSTETLLDGLYFANGVALSQDESFVLVNETYRYRIRRYWLTGPSAGTDDIFIDRLPGFPDGVSANRQGTFWVALFTVRNPLMDSLHPSPWAKSNLAKLPKMFWPKPAPYGLVVALDEQGRAVRSLHDPGGRHVSHITSVEEVDGRLYLGNLDLDWIGVYRLE